MNPKTLVVRLQVPSTATQPAKLLPPPPPPPETTTTNQGPQQALKEEAVDEQQTTAYELPTPDNAILALKTPTIDPSPTPTPESLAQLPDSGKRKRKPKDIYDSEVSTFIIRNRKQKPASKSKQVLLNSGAKSLSHKQEDGNGETSNNRTPVKSQTLIRAEEVQSSLGNEYPSFLKTLVRSNVASCFLMGLPSPFGKQHLPRKDVLVVLENESGEQFEIKYIAEKTGLSAGWRKFVVAHKLLEGDVLIFQLIAPIKFKVRVIRANDLNEVDGALSLLNLDSLAKQLDAEGITALNDKKKLPKSLSLSVVQKRKKEKSISGLAPVAVSMPEEHSCNDSDEVASEVLEDTKFHQAVTRFKDIKNFEDFHIVVNGVCIDSELPEHIRRKYYDLCCRKNAYLHERLLPGIYCKLPAGMIFELVNTVDAIRACKVTTPRKEFENWDKSLRSFELLGMKVGFLRAHLKRLVSLAFDTEGAVETKRYWEVKTEHARREDEIKSLEEKLERLKEVSERYDSDIEFMRPGAESFELMFQKEVNAPF